MIKFKAKNTKKNIFFVFSNHQPHRHRIHRFFVLMLVLSMIFSPFYVLRSLRSPSATQSPKPLLRNIILGVNVPLVFHIRIKSRFRVQNRLIAINNPNRRFTIRLKTSGNNYQR